MKRVFICSPYASQDGRIQSVNIAKAQEMCEDALLRGCAPFASHLLYPQVLSDEKENERALGIDAGLSFLAVCDEVWAWVGWGVSEGMAQELAEAARLGTPVVRMGGEG